MKLEATTLVSEAQNEYVTVNDLARPGQTELVRLSSVMESTEKMTWFWENGHDMDTMTFGELEALRGDLFGEVKSE